MKNCNPTLNVGFIKFADLLTEGTHVLLTCIISLDVSELLLY
jgi:hypothetical protein